MTLKQNIANNLKFTRIFLGLSQIEVQKTVNIPQSKLSRIEKGVHSPNSEELLALSKLYHVSIDWIFKNDSMIKPNNGSNMWELRQSLNVGIELSD